MKVITVKVEGENDAATLEAILHSLNYIESIEVFEEENELSDSEIQMVEERLDAYKKNPDSTLTWEEVKSKIIKKHGL